MCFLKPIAGICKHERRSMGAMVTGIIVMAFAAAGGIAGVTFLTIGGRIPDGYKIVPLVTAGVGLASGIPLIVWGTPKRDRDEAVIRAGFGASGLTLEATF